LIASGNVSQVSNIIDSNLHTHDAAGKIEREMIAKLCVAKP
jgi:hypothetical protein